ncbi:MAG: uroporphyrinogen decarboxylase family protein [Clostridium sp.]
MFKCVSDNIEDIPKEIILKHCDFYQNIDKGEFMSEISKEIKLLRKDVFCKLPFCHTIETEAFGGVIKPSDESGAARVKEYVVSNLYDLDKIRSMDFSAKRINEVLKGIKILSSEKENVLLKVTGVMTIANSLMDSKVFYKLYRKNKNEVIKVLEIIQDSIVEYIKIAIKNGVKIISYAEPVGNVDIIGPKYFKELTGKITCNLIKQLDDELRNNDVIFHICGRTSTSLEECDFATIKNIYVKENLNYGESLINLLDRKEKNLIVVGHWCVKRTFLKKNDNKIILLEF